MTTRRLRYLVGLLIALFAPAGCSPSTVVPNVAMFTGEAGGCGNFSIYRFNRNRTLALHLSVDEKGFGIAEGSTEIAIENAPARVRLEVMQFAGPAGDYFCDDVAGDPEPIATWIAVAGQIHVQCDRLAPPPGNATHQISVILKNIRIRNEKTGTFTTLPRVEINGVWVGWIPG